ncbi:MAG: TlyA family RNA methyltransferase [Elusimicrobiota bacterium]|jgi:23S rRNA (cytidine1920-2'-O)/16S rRNA (cytidine1409-2'-O)-methyltransferase|nr:TlyA family RNA methyltransferase [Elusimicrobiota bacterium]
MPKPRLDNALAEQNLAPSRSKAQAMIMAGEVLVNGQAETRADRTIKPQDIITLKEKSCPYVSRGGLKLKAALDAFKIDVKNKICADIGVATGGFSHVFLLQGAAEVYGIDVGKGQLASEVAAFKNFHFRPNTNARYLTPDMFDKKFEAAAVDVSFISLKMIMAPLLACMAAQGDIVFLIKPQFELTPKDVPRGIVKTQENRQKAIALVQDYFEQNLAQKFNAESAQLTESPIRGAHGNIEYLWHVKTGGKHG